MKHDLSVIIPTYKEETRIERCIKESLFFLRNNEKIKNFEIIFVADDAGDKTIDIIKSNLKENKELKLIVNPKREQKGGSVKIGMLEAKYDQIVFFDVDLSTPLYEINESLDLIEKYDIVIGSRGMKESKIEKKYFAIFLSQCFSLLKLLVVGLKFKDTQCGFKMFKRKTMPIFEKQRIKSSFFDVEILYIAKKMKYTIKEKPITWIDSDASNFNQGKVVISFLKELIRMKWYALKGYYNQ
jgi:dolichyl-phosphate beta-glucosyltransferase